MATRNEVVSLVRQTLEHPFECIKVISKYVVDNYTMDIPYSHIWTSYIANKVGLDCTQAPLTASCDKGANWFRKRKRYKLGQAYGGDYNPQLGDYIYLSSTYEQADATNVGIVLESDGTLVTIACWYCDGGCPKEWTCYLHDPIIIGYGIPEYEDTISPIELPVLATKGYGVAIIGEEDYVHVGPDGETRMIGTIKKGHAVEVLNITPTGWLKVVWGLSPSGYGYIDNIELYHKVIKDEVPYPRYEGFKVGDKVQFKGGKIYHTKKEKSKNKMNVKPFVAKITGVSDNRYYIEEQVGIKRKGWVEKSNVDFTPENGYDKCTGEIVEPNPCLRIGPGDEFTKVQKWPQMAMGNKVDILGTDIDNNGDEWFLIVISGVKGYVKDYCVKFIEA